MSVGEPCTLVLNIEQYKFFLHALGDLLQRSGHRNTLWEDGNSVHVYCRYDPFFFLLAGRIDPHSIRLLIVCSHTRECSSKEEDCGWSSVPSGKRDSGRNIAQVHLTRRYPSPTVLPFTFCVHEETLPGCCASSIRLVLVYVYRINAPVF